jgi:hypothetical protein
LERLETLAFTLLSGASIFTIVHQLG